MFSSLSTLLNFELTHAAPQNDVVINELMYNPDTGSSVGDGTQNGINKLSETGSSMILIVSAVLVLLGLGAYLANKKLPKYANKK